MKRTELQRKQSIRERRGRPVEKTCESCGVKFVAEDRRKRYCSPECSYAGMRARLSRGKMIPCAECGATFYVRPGALGRGAKYCSRACFHAKGRKSPEALERMGEDFRRKHRGSGNPQWKGKDTNGSIYRVFNVKLKGEERCRNCGSSESLHLHHIVPRSMCKAARRDLRNGVPLCAACHARWHARSVTIYRNILTDEEWSYVSSLELLGQNIAAWLDDRYPAPVRVEVAPE